MNRTVKLPDIERQGIVLSKKLAIWVMTLDDVSNNFIMSILMISNCIKQNKDIRYRPARTINIFIIFLVANPIRKPPKPLIPKERNNCVKKSNISISRDNIYNFENIELFNTIMLRKYVSEKCEGLEGQVSFIRQLK